MILYPHNVHVPRKVQFWVHHWATYILKLLLHMLLAQYKVVQRSIQKIYDLLFQSRAIQLSKDREDIIVKKGLRTIFNIFI